MDYTLIDHRNDVITCSKLKWNHEPQAGVFTAKFWTFYGVISMVYKSVDHRKLWSICFLQQHLFLVSILRSFLENHAWHVTSFPSKTIAIDQSAREDSLSYCKKYISNGSVWTRWPVKFFSRLKIHPLRMRVHVAWDSVYTGPKKFFLSGQKLAQIRLSFRWDPRNRASL